MVWQSYVVFLSLWFSLPTGEACGSTFHLFLPVLVETGAMCLRMCLPVCVHMCVCLCGSVWLKMVCLCNCAGLTLCLPVYVTLYVCLSVELSACLWACVTVCAAPGGAVQSFDSVLLILQTAASSLFQASCSSHLL